MSHEQDAAGIRSRIGKAHGMMAQIRREDEAITQGATARLGQVLARLEQLRPKVILDHDAADEYLDLTREKGALLRTLAKS